MQSIDVPGDVSLNIGEQLTINWRKACKFCVISNTGATFDQALPAGGQQGGPPWVGTAKTAGVITFTHVDNDGDCNGITATGGGGRTITVGSGAEAKS